MSMKVTDNLVSTCVVKMTSYQRGKILQPWENPWEIKVNLFTLQTILQYGATLSFLSKWRHWFWFFGLLCWINFERSFHIFRSDPACELGCLRCEQLSFPWNSAFETKIIAIFGQETWKFVRNYERTQSFGQPGRAERRPQTHAESAKTKAPPWRSWWNVRFQSACRRYSWIIS